MAAYTRVLYASGDSLEQLSEGIAAMLSGYPPDDVLHLSHAVHPGELPVYSAVVLVRVDDTRLRRLRRSGDGG